MKILLLGKNGQVGWELQRALAPLGELTALDRAPEGGLCGDLADTDGLRATIRAVRPDVIVNAAAHTAVDKAESEVELAHAVNAAGPALLAEEAARTNAWLIHYSTDYVFDGAKTGAYVEDDTPNPQSVYGASKLAGEQAIQASGARHLIFRTSWVFAARGGNFAKTMLRLARERDVLNVVADQIGAPTSAELIADVTALCLQRVRSSEAADPLSGLYHLVSAEETSWHGYARHVIATALARGRKLALTPEQINPIATSDYPLPAKRPPNSRLDTTKLRDTFGLTLPHWQYHVDRMLEELIDRQDA